MAINEDRFSKLVQRVKKLEDDSTSQTGAKPDVTTGAKPDVTIPRTPPIIAWIPGIAALVALLGVGVPVAIHLNNRIDSVKTDVGVLGTKLDKLDAAVIALSSQQSDQTQKLVHDLLATAANSQQPELIERIITAANSLTVTLSRNKQPATQDFFISTSKSIEQLSQRKNPSIKTVGLSAQQHLAEYRSALNPIPSLPKEVAAGGSIFAPSETPKVYLTNMTLAFPPGGYMTIEGNGSELVASPSHPDSDLFGAVSRPAGFAATIRNLILHGPSQTLDDIEWQNVTFLDMHIKYLGGKLSLQNVRFVNCTFEFPRNDLGLEFAQYATLEPKNALKIG